MNNNFKSRFSVLRENKGSSIIIVILAIFFISVLGASSMFVSYTGMRMKVSERYGQVSFYDAASAMSEVETMLQKAVSEAIETSYEDVLINYSDLASRDLLLTSFHNQYQEDILAWDADKNAHSLEDKLIVNVALEGSGSTEVLNAQYIALYLATLYGEDAAVDTTSNGIEAKLTTNDGVYLITTGEVTYTDLSIPDAEPEEIILQDVSIHFTSADTGYSSEVKSDISLLMPPFSGNIIIASSATIPDYVLISNGEFTGSSGTIESNHATTEGNVYVNNYTDGSVNISSGQFVIGNNAEIKQGAEIIVRANASIWANDILLLLPDAKFTLLENGNAYVADDLELSANTEAELSGNYFGFGSATPESNPELNEHAQQSSAIVINGSGAKLHRYSDSTLMLAGYSYVDGYGADDETIMGESLSVRSNQQAYLIPSEYLDGVWANPYVTEPGIQPNPSLDEDGFLWNVNEEDMRISDYGITLKRVPVMLSSSQVAHYFFMNFENPDDATAYFADYFEVNNDIIEAYAGNYLDISDPLNSDFTGIAVDTEVLANGNVMAVGEDGNFDLVEEKQRPFVLPAQLKDTYDGLRTTLSTVEDNSTNPYENIVDVSAVDTLRSGTVFNFMLDTNRDGTPDTTSAIIATGNYNVSAATPSSVRAIIATGDVTVSDDFTGLIMTSGDVEVLGGVTLTSNRDEVLNVLNAEMTNDDGNTVEFIDYLYLLSPGENHVDSGDNWDPESLVEFANWEKK